MSFTSSYCIQSRPIIFDVITWTPIDYQIEDISYKMQYEETVENVFPSLQ